MGYFTVSELRRVGEIEVLCGMRRLVPGETTNVPWVLAVAAQAEDSIDFQVGMHLRSDNYEEATTRLIGIVIGETGPITLYQVGAGGALSIDRTIETPILFVEIAGSKAPPADRTKFDEQILMYEPEEVQAEEAKATKRPWWKFW